MLEKNDIKEITDLMGVMYPKLVITDFIKIKKNLMELKRELKENKLDTYKSSEYNVPEGIKE